MSGKLVGTKETLSITCFLSIQSSNILTGLTQKIIVSMLENLIYAFFSKLKNVV